MKYLGLRSHTIVWPLAVSSGLSIALFGARALSSHNTRYWFLLWNLFLAWLPLFFAVFLVNHLKNNRWLSLKGIALTLLWLGFLPNSFYLVSDFVHLRATGDVSVLYDVVLFMSYAWNGMLLGFTALLLVHWQLAKRVGRNQAVWIIGLIILLCSFAIYLGRYLSWNTWDILTNPGGILFDVSERLVQPSSYPNTFKITALFTVALSVMYYTVYKLVAAITGERPEKLKVDKS